MTHNGTYVPCILSIAQGQAVADPGQTLADACLNQQVGPAPRQGVHRRLRHPL